MREVSLAEAVRTFPPATLRPMLEVRLRELELVRIRLAPGFQSLAQDHIITLADLLGKPRHSAGADRRESSPRQQATPTQGMRHTSSVVKQLTALDARRLAYEAQLDRKKTPPTRTSLAP